MSNPLPTLRLTAQQALYPFVRNITFQTVVNQFAGAQEQRWPSRPPLFTFDMPMSTLAKADRDTWLSFFTARNGRFTQDLTLTLGSTTYSNLTLMSDDFGQVLKVALLFDQQVSLRQVRNGTWTPPAVGTTFPNLTGLGAVAEMPYTPTAVELTGISDNPSGPRFAFSYYGAALTNFPSAALHKITIEYPLLSDAGALDLENFFISVQGKAYTFDFPEPISGTTLHNMRFDMDTLAMKYITKNQNSTKIVLVQTN